MTPDPMNWKVDNLAKSPFYALRCILRLPVRCTQTGHCDVAISTSLSSEFARLETGAFYFAVQILTFYEFIILKGSYIENEEGFKV